MHTVVNPSPFNRFLRMPLLAVLLLGTLLFGGKTAVFSQEPPPDLIQIMQVNDSAFPLVTVTLRTINAQGGEVDLRGASFRENGIPVDFEWVTAPAGRDIVFVLDANETMRLDDNGDGLSRYEEAAASINQFAQTLRPDLDAVSIVVPDETLTNGRFLIQDASDPAAIQAALAAYEPAGVWPLPLQAMLNQALDHATLGGNGRYLAVLLFTDAGRLHSQLDYEALLQTAQAHDIPLFGAVMGSDMTAEEQFRLERLTRPARGLTIHMPTAAAAEAIFAVWREQAEWPQIQYQSLQRQSGDYPLALNVNGQRVVGDLSLTLLPPEIEALPPHAPIVRRGPAPDTPITDLAPKQATIPVQISWPDGKPRALTDLVWQVNGRRQPALNTIQPNSQGQLQLAWNMELATEGRYELVVDVADEFGFAATSPLAALEVVVERPLLPTATPLPPTPPAPEPTAVMPGDPLMWLKIIGGLGVTAVLLLLITWWRSRKQSLASQTEGPSPTDRSAPSPLPPPTPHTTYDAYLEPINAPDLALYHIDSSNLVIGRDENEADLALADNSMAPLHARITCQNETYWLYDEGSAHGTYLNYTRLGLAPQALTDNDTISIGRLQFRFILRIREA